MSKQAVAVAHPNIALIKYWGKRDEQLILPVNSSLSMTLDIFPTTTTVTLPPGLAADQIELNGQQAEGVAADRVVAFLELVRGLAGRTEYARVSSTNTVPTGAGLASSAAGFAALAAAAAEVYGLELDSRALSRLARRGSGSASRSVLGGFVQWNAGEDDESSYAEAVAWDGLDAAMVVGIIDAGPKAISSREAMSRTVATSPFYRGWHQACDEDLAAMRAAIAAVDLPLVGEIAERNALRMHATMLGAVPPVRYLTAGTMSVLDLVADLRRQGVGAWATMDAGPNVKVICAAADAETVAAAMTASGHVAQTLAARPGPGVSLTKADTAS
ncbi:MAG: diphosphomevalonate decarboxylase [Arachnia propionica]|nr:MAG: diphosphomevalonate decarboxylase [Arachnia propionica]